MTKHPLAVRAEIVRIYAGAVRRLFAANGDKGLPEAVLILLSLAEETAALAESMAQRDELADVIRKLDREMGRPPLRLVEGKTK